ncbi:MAG: outer membrane beta-barrel protein [Ginsengibacter sp.]
MDKNLPDIENLFKKALEGNEENPSQKAWDGIEKKLDKDNVVSIKKKYELLKKVALLLILLLAALSIYLFKIRDKNSVKPEEDISSVNNETPTKSNLLKDKSGSIILQKRLDSLAFNNSNNMKQLAKDSHQVVAKTILKEEKVILQKSLNSLTEKILTNNSIAENKIKTEKWVQSHFTGFPIHEKDNLVNRKSNEVVETKLPGLIDSKQQSVVVNPTDIQLRDIALGQINPIIQIENSVVSQPSIRSKRQARFSITAFYSPDIAFYNFENKEPGNSNNTNFEKSETENFSSTFGALIDYSISKHWGFQSGITLATSNFNLQPKTIYAQPDNSGGIQYKLSTPLGDAFVKPSFSSNPNIGDSLFSKSTTHTIQYIGIPLAVKYSFNKAKFTLNILGGIAANFLTRGRITTELESGNDNEKETANKIHGLKSSYFSGLAGIGIDYNLYKNLAITITPTFRFALNPINDNVISQSFPNSVGFVLGLNIKL